MINEALHHLEKLLRICNCAAPGRFYGRPLNETCAEYHTAILKRPSPGCVVCEAVEFLKKAKLEAKREELKFTDESVKDPPCDDPIYFGRDTMNHHIYRKK